MTLEVCAAATTSTSQSTFAMAGAVVNQTLEHTRMRPPAHSWASHAHDPEKLMPLQGYGHRLRAKHKIAADSPALEGAWPPNMALLFSESAKRGSCGPHTAVTQLGRDLVTTNVDVFFLVPMRVVWGAMRPKSQYPTRSARSTAR